MVEPSGCASDMSKEASSSGGSSPCGAPEANSVPRLRESEKDIQANRSSAIRRLSKLRPFPATVLRLVSVSAEAGSAADDFELIFGSDPALASRLLRVANSPLCGICGRVESVPEAIALMGLEGVRSLAVTLAIGSHLSAAQSPEHVRSVWGHSLATAVIAETMGTVCGQDVPLLYTAGLLHDLGRLGLLNIEGPRYAEVLARKYFDVDESLLLEDLLFGCAHEDAGAFLGRSWGFPEPLCVCMRHHHQPASEGDFLLQQMVQLACSKAASLGMGEVQCEQEKPAALDESLAARIFQAPAMQPECLLSRIHEMVETLASVDAHPQPVAQ